MAAARSSMLWLIDIDHIVVFKFENVLQLIDTNVGSLRLAKHPSSHAEQHFDDLGSNARVRCKRCTLCRGPPCCFCLNASGKHSCCLLRYQLSNGHAPQAMQAPCDLYLSHLDELYKAIQPINAVDLPVSDQREVRVMRMADAKAVSLQALLKDTPGRFAQIATYKQACISQFSGSGEEMEMTVALSEAIKRPLQIWKVRAIPNFDNFIQCYCILTWVQAHRESLSYHNLSS
jgi:hypothetical protein